MRGRIRCAVIAAQFARHVFSYLPSVRRPRTRDLRLAIRLAHCRGRTCPLGSSSRSVRRPFASGFKTEARRGLQAITNGDVQQTARVLPSGDYIINNPIKHSLFRCVIRLKRRLNRGRVMSALSGKRSNQSCNATFNTKTTLEGTVYWLTKGHKQSVPCYIVRTARCDANVLPTISQCVIVLPLTSIDGFCFVYMYLQFALRSAPKRL